LETLLEDCTRFAGNEVPYAVETLARLKKVRLPTAAQCAAAPKIDDESRSQVVDLEIVPVKKTYAT
jgi:hypothetical protein